MTLHCLHGFLGAPGDWDDFRSALGGRMPALSPRDAIVTPDFFGADAFPSAASLASWADAYAARWVQVPRPSGTILLGYSLGGRLALHLAVQWPQLWEGIIIVGAHPGLDSDEARAQRRARDETWARHFETEPWDTLTEAWNAQPVFAGRAALRPPRREQDFDRARLADALRRWSLGAQQPLWPRLAAISCPVLWVAGEDDTAQIPICRRVQEHLPHAQVQVIPGAGHRVPWEQPDVFAARVAEFLGAVRAGSA